MKLSDAKDFFLVDATNSTAQSKLEVRALCPNPVIHPVIYIHLVNDSENDVLGKCV